MIYIAVCLLAAIGGFMVLAALFLLSCMALDLINEKVEGWLWGQRQAIADEVERRIKEIEWQKKWDAERGTKK